MHHIPMCFVFYTFICRSPNVIWESLRYSVASFMVLKLCFLSVYQAIDLHLLPGLTEHSECTYTSIYTCTCTSLYIKCPFTDSWFVDQVLTQQTSSTLTIWSPSYIALSIAWSKFKIYTYILEKRLWLRIRNSLNTDSVKKNYMNYIHTAVLHETPLIYE